MLCSSDVKVLITYSSFVESAFIMLSVSGILWLRYKQPDMERPIKVYSEFISEKKKKLKVPDTLFFFTFSS